MLAINRHYLLGPGAMDLQMTHLKSSVKAAYTINDDLQYHKLPLHFPHEGATVCRGSCFVSTPIFRCIANN